MKQIHVHIHRGKTNDFIRGELAAERHVAKLYAGHPLAEASRDAMRAWAEGQGFSMKPEPHVTTAATRKAIDRRQVPRMSGGLVIPSGGRSIQQFGDHLVMCVNCPELAARHEEYKKAGAVWDFPTYQPHITIGRAANLPPAAEIDIWDEPITLGAEVLAPFDDY